MEMVCYGNKRTLPSVVECIETTVTCKSLSGCCITIKIKD